MKLAWVMLLMVLASVALGLLAGSAASGVVEACR